MNFLKYLHKKQERKEKSKKERTKRVKMEGTEPKRRTCEKDREEKVTVDSSSSSKS